MKAKCLCHVVSVLVLLPGLFISVYDSAAESPNEGVVLAAGVEAMPCLPHGPFVRLGDGRIMGVDKRDAIFSSDDGKTWTRRPIFAPDQEFEIRPERALLRTRSGVIILLFINDAVRHYSWNKEKNVPNPDMLLPSYSIRSLDEGKTWTDLNLLHGGWCGCLQDVIQTSNGNIVVPGQELLYKEGRHATMPYVSDDDGKTWQRTRYLDIGGQGDHAGAIEGTVEQLKDGRLWMLIRSYHGFFYESFSSDEGLSWCDIKPSTVRSTGSPGKLVRLASGRLALFWNAIPTEGYVRREELSLSFSEDEGANWSPPQVIARNKGGRVSYVDVFEHSPGVLWITTMQGDLRVRLREGDFLHNGIKIVAFGDSTTALRGKLKVYADRITQAKEAGAWVINAGIGGNNTDDARRRFKTDVLDQQPDIVIIQFGINDAAVDVWKNPPATKSRVSRARYKENLEYFIGELTAKGIKVILMTPNPTRWVEKTRELYGKPPYKPDDPDGFNVLLRGYAEVVREVAKEMGIDLVDVYASYQLYNDQEGKSMDDLLLDGMHPNDAGHRRIAELLLEKITASR